MLTMDCIIWTGSVDTHGYGALNIKRPGERWSLHRAHRLSWEIANGKKPAGMVLHRCHNRLCINPEHLYVGNHAQNMADRASSGRNRSGRDRLTKELVSKIRNLCVNHKQRDVAAMMKLPKSTIGDVMSGRCWKDL